MSNERTASVSQLIPDSHDIDLLTADTNTSSSSSHHSHKLFTPSARSAAAVAGPGGSTSSSTSSGMLNSIASSASTPHLNNNKNNIGMNMDSYSAGYDSPLMQHHHHHHQSSTVSGLVSPILASTSGDNYDSVFSNAGLSIQRPLSAKDITVGGGGNVISGDDPLLRSFSAQGGPISSTNNSNGQNITSISGILNSAADIERPLSSMEIDSTTFKNDVGNLIQWIGTLNSNQLRAMIDNLLPSLNDEILNYTRSKLANFQFQNNSHQQTIYQHHNEQPVNLDSVLNESMHSPQQQQQHHSNQQNHGHYSINNLQRALSPGGYSSFDRTALLQEASFNRPRSADPYSKLVNQHQLHRTPSKNRSNHHQNNNTNNNNNNNSTGTANNNNESSSTSGNRGAFDITNLAQQLTQAQINVNDYSNPNLLKLSALSTINSRAQLDSNKKGRITDSPQQQQQQQVPIGKQQHAVHANGSVSSQQMTQSSSLSKQYNNNNNYTAYVNHHNNSSTSTPSKPTTNQSTASTPKNPTIDTTQLTSPQLLQNIPLWLKTLRLHKYTPVLGTIPWRQLIQMNETELEQRGVSALGARGKLMKAFEVVRGAVERREI